MKKHVNGMRTGSLMRSRRLQVIGVVAIVIVFAIAATAISMHAGKGEPSGLPAASSSTNSLPLRPGQNTQSFAQAQIRPLTQEEAQQMAEGLKHLVNQSTEGLTQVRHADGSVSMDLQGRFQNVALARKGTDGHVTQSCVDNPESAAAFLGFDRELIDGTPSRGRTPGKPAEIDPVTKGQH